MTNSRRSLRTSLLNAALLTTVVYPTLHAADLYFDANGAAPGSGNVSAPWDTGFSWSTDPTGSIPQVAWTSGSTAIFSAGTDGLTMTVTAAGVVTTPAIIVEEAGTLTLAGAGIAIGGGLINTSPLGPDAGHNVVISAPLSGSGGLTIQSHGNDSSDSELELTGANTFQGTLQITSGIVGWNNDAAFGAAANGITLNGGGLVDMNRNLSIARNVTIGANGGRIRSYGNANTTLDGNLLGSGTLTKTDGGGLSFLRNDYGFTGTLDVQGGSARVGNGTSGSLSGIAGINIGPSGALWVRRTDSVNASAILPANITFAATGSRFEYNPTSQDAVLTLDRDLGSPAAPGIVRVSGGTLVLANGTAVNASQVMLGLQSATNRGVLNIGPGSTITSPVFDLGQTGSGSGTVNQTGGTATVTAGGFGFRIGHWDNGANPGSVYNLSGGTLDASGLTGNTGTARFVNIGWDGQANMTVGGGSSSATLKAWGIQLDANNDSAAYSDNLTLSTNGRIELGGGNISSASANDRLYLNGGTIVAAENARINAPAVANTGTTTTLDANGWVLTLASDITGTGTLHLTGTEMGGAIDIPTGTGTRIIDAVLAGSALLTKGESGTLTLTGASTHTGDFYVSAGTLNLVGSIASNLVDVNGSTLRGEGSLGGNLAFGFSAPSTLLINPQTPGALSVAGDVEIVGDNVLSFSSPFSGTVTALTYSGTRTGGGSFSLAGQSNYRSASVDLSTPGQIKATNNNANLTWAGSTGVWDLNATTGWTNGGNNTFYWGDAVLFNESATNKNVTLAGELAPFGITVDSTSNYAITGSEGNFLSGIGGLLKKGTSTLTMNGVNTFTGGTVISNGAINVQSAGALGTGSVVLGDAATGASNVALYLDTNRINFGTQVRISADGTGTATLGSRASVVGSGDNSQFTNIVLGRDVIFDSNGADRTDYENITGTGNITLVGTGRSNLVTTPANWTGNVTTNGTGILQIGVASTAGNRIPDSSNLTVGPNGIANLSTAGETIAGLNGTGKLGTNSPSGGIATLSVGFGNADGNFSGILQGGTSLALTKIGLGTQTLTGTNTHSGRTTITAGKLAINGETALGTAPAALVADQLLFNGGTLQAIGSFAIDDANRGITTNAPGGTFEVATGQTLDIVSPLVGAGAIAKTGPGLMTSTGGSWTGVTTISDGTLRMLAKAGFSDYVVSPGGTLEIGYTSTSNYNTGVVVHGAGTASTTGLHLLAGTSLNLQRNGGLRLATAPTTIRTYGGGAATLAGWDINAVHLTAEAAASGSIISSDITVNTGAYGYRMDIASGANTASGDVVFAGPITGDGSVAKGGIEINLMKYGAGSLRLDGQGSYPEGIWVREGAVILGGDQRMAATAAIVFGDGATSGTLALNGFKQTLSNIAYHNGATNSQIIGGASAMGELTLDYSGADHTILGTIGGAGNNANLGIVKSGSGKIILGGTLAYNGNTTVNAGILTLPTAALADSSVVAVNGTGKLDLTHGTNDTVSTLLFDGAAQATGTWGSSDSAAQHFDNDRFSGTGMITVTSTGSPYMAWESANGIAGAGGSADSDGDGIANAIEFVLGTDPSGPDSSSNANLPTVTVDATHLTFVFRRTDESMAMAAALQPYVQFGSDLTGWTKAVQGQPVANPVQIIEENNAIGAGIDRVTVKIPRAVVNPGVKLFARLRADIP